MTPQAAAEKIYKEFSKLGVKTLNLASVRDADLDAFNKASNELNSEKFRLRLFTLLTRYRIPQFLSLAAQALVKKHSVCENHAALALYLALQIAKDPKTEGNMPPIDMLAVLLDEQRGLLHMIAVVGVPNSVARQGMPLKNLLEVTKDVDPPPYVVDLWGGHGEQNLHVYPLVEILEKFYELGDTLKRNMFYGGDLYTSCHFFDVTLRVADFKEKYPHIFEEIGNQTLPQKLHSAFANWSSLLAIPSVSIAISLTLIILSYYLNLFSPNPQSPLPSLRNTPS